MRYKNFPARPATILKFPSHYLSHYYFSATILTIWYLLALHNIEISSLEFPDCDYMKED